jgi:WD40 repeat protein
MKTSILFTASRQLRLAAFAAALAFGLSAVQPAQAYSFVETGTMNTGRFVHSATLLANGQVMVAGGFNSNIGELASTETYNPASGNWITNGEMINPRSDHPATLLPNGKVLIAGGDNYSGALTNAELFDPASGTWTATGSMTNARTYHTATLLPNGKVLVTGGYNSTSYLISCELYDPATGTWTNTGSLNYPRIQHTATVLTNGLVLVVGGDGSGYCELYNPATGIWTVTGTNLVPRQNLTATLLPNGLMLVAGGSGDNTAELYNPGTGLWTATGLMNASRVAPTATLLPSGQVLVAGGFGDFNDTNVLASTEIYDPASATWITNLDMISVRAQQTATLLPNGNVLMAGGYDGTNSVDITELYFSPPMVSPGMWTLTGSLTNALYLHTATLLPNGKVLVVGGADYSGNVFAAAQLYDSTNGTWTGTNAMAKARYAHTATLLANGKVLVAGGTTNQYDPTSASLVQPAELFNPTNDTWATTGPLNFPRFFHTATLLANGKVLVTGGMSSNSYPITILNSSELYDPATGSWTITGPLHEARYNHTATLLPSGKVLVTGGQVTNVFLVTGSAELYDPVTGTWTATGSMPYPLANHTATWLPKGKLLVAGGDIDEGSIGGIGLVPVPFAELYDPATELWTTTTSMHFVHDYHTATLLANGLVLIAGGGSNFGSTTNCAELYEPFSQMWTTAATMNAPRQHHTATLLPNGRVLAAGGSGNSGLLASAELYNSIAATMIRIINPTRLPGGAFQFGFTNTPGAGFTALATTNLSLSSSNWRVIGSIPEISPGVFQFADPQATNSPRRFYRVRSP